LLDEADRVIRGSNEELVAVLNSSHRRSGAYVWRVVDVRSCSAEIQYMGRRGVCWHSRAAEHPAGQKPRIRLSKAKPGEVPAHLRNGTSPALRTLKRKLARWAIDLTRLPEPTLPEGLYNRAGDNWGPIFSIAALAGGRWSQLVGQAAFAALAADQAESVLVALLDGVRRAFGGRDRLRTRELLDTLLADDEFDWGTANRGKPINDAWLRERLRGVSHQQPMGGPAASAGARTTTRSAGTAVSVSRTPGADTYPLSKRPQITRPIRPTRPRH
jgi:hypothetical protein